MLRVHPPPNFHPAAWLRQDRCPLKGHATGGLEPASRSGREITKRVHRDDAKHRPPAAKFPARFVPDTWVTLHTGDIGNTFAPKGLGKGSNLELIVSKNPRSYCIKDTSRLGSH